MSKNSKADCIYAKGLLCMVTEAWQEKVIHLQSGVMSICFKTTSILPLKKKGKTLSQAIYLMKYISLKIVNMP